VAAVGGIWRPLGRRRSCFCCRGRRTQERNRRRHPAAGVQAPAARFFPQEAAVMDEEDGLDPKAREDASKMGPEADVTSTLEDAELTNTPGNKQAIKETRPERNEQKTKPGAEGPMQCTPQHDRHEFLPPSLRDGQLMILKALQHVMGSSLERESKEDLFEMADIPWKNVTQKKTCKKKANTMCGFPEENGSPTLDVENRTVPEAVTELLSSLAAAVDCLERTYLPDASPPSTSLNTNRTFVGEELYMDDAVAEVELVAEVQIDDVGLCSATQSRLFRSDQNWRLCKSVCLGPTVLPARGESLLSFRDTFSSLSPPTRLRSKDHTPRMRPSRSPKTLGRTRNTPATTTALSGNKSLRTVDEKYICCPRDSDSLVVQLPDIACPVLDFNNACTPLRAPHAFDSNQTTSRFGVSRTGVAQDSGLHPCWGYTLGNGTGVSNGQPGPFAGGSCSSSSGNQHSQPPTNSLEKAESISCSSSSSSPSQHHSDSGGGDGFGMQGHTPQNQEIYDPFHPTDEENLNGDFSYGHSPEKELEDEKYDPFEPTGSNASSSERSPSPYEDDDDIPDPEDRLSEALASIYEDDDDDDDLGPIHKTRPPDTPAITYEDDNSIFDPEDKISGEPVSPYDENSAPYDENSVPYDDESDAHIDYVNDLRIDDEDCVPDDDDGARIDDDSVPVEDEDCALIDEEDCVPVDDEDGVSTDDNCVPVDDDAPIEKKYDLCRNKNSVTVDKNSVHVHSVPNDESITIDNENDVPVDKTDSSIVDERAGPVDSATNNPIAENVSVDNVKDIPLDEPGVLVNSETNIPTDADIRSDEPDIHIDQPTIHIDKKTELSAESEISIAVDIEASIPADADIKHNIPIDANSDISDAKHGTPIDSEDDVPTPLDGEDNAPSDSENDLPLDSENDAPNTEDKISVVLASIYDDNSLSQDFPGSEKPREDSCVQLEQKEVCKENDNPLDKESVSG
ncbi:hypothetical protein NDU88_010228, partial [Pleurodeles waltl]